MAPAGAHSKCHFGIGGARFEEAVAAPCRLNVEAGGFARMADQLGWRCKFGVVAPATNTIVQPEYDDLRLPGITNHYSRIVLDNVPLSDDAEFGRLIDLIKSSLEPALDQVMSCEPDAVILGMSAETFWDGMDGAEALKRRLEARCGKPVTLGSHACAAALEAYSTSGPIKRLGVITPYQPIGDRQVRRFFTDLGYEVGDIIGLRCASPIAIAHVEQGALRSAINRLAATGVDAVVQVGTNLCMARLAAEAERWLGLPVVAINVATYWHALRSNGFRDARPDRGRLFEEF